jgi:hypothetical protein
MAPPPARHLTLAVLASLAACGGSETPVGPAGGVFSIGQSISVDAGRDIRVLSGSVDGEYVAVVANIALDSNTKTDFTLRSTGVLPAPASTSVPVAVPNFDLRPTEATALNPRRDEAFEDRLRDREIAELTPRMGAARAWNAARIPALPSNPAVGDLVTVNVNVTEACTNPVYHAARVMAVGTKALVLNDTLNPKVGFTTADYQRYAAKFDTLIYPLDVAAFGEPTDIDKNGHIAIVFTRAVNELTPRSSGSYVGGLAFTRDLFPQLATSRTQACPASNEGEYFYLMTPDPSGTINSNRRTTGFVDSNTTAVIAHELQHTINASRKLYVNTAAPRFEDKWLDEGLAHIAEELLFYRESGLTPRSNLTYASLVGTARARAAYLTDMSGNANRYQDFLTATTKSSPYTTGDSLTTRGAAWSLLRYLADRNGPTDGDVWSRLVNNTATGTSNLQSVFGTGVAQMVRDWSESLAVDDLPNAPDVAQQKSWNWRSVYGGPSGASALYPLQVTTMANATSYNGNVIAGGSAFLKLFVPANSIATLTLGGQSGAASNLQLVIVRTK